MREFVGWIKPVKFASMILIMTNTALHNTALHNTKPRWHKLNLVGTILNFVGTILHCTVLHCTILVGSLEQFVHIPR